jgi:hypothetical protein
MFRVESPQGGLGSLLSQTANVASENFVQNQQHQKKAKEIQDVLGPLNEDSSPFEWMKGIQGLRYASPEDKKMMLHTIEEGNKHRAEQKKMQAAQAQHQRQSELMFKANAPGQPASQGATASQGSQKSGTLSKEEIAELPIGEQSKYYKGLEEKVLGGLGGQPIPDDVQERINEVSEKNRNANPEKYRQALMNAKIPPAYIEPLVKDRTESLKIEAERENANEGRVGRSYDRHKDFIAATTKSARAYTERDRKNLMQMDALNEKALITATGAAFLEKLGLPLSLAGNPDSEVFEKLSNELVTGVGAAFGTSRILEFEVETFVKTIPTLMNSKEGRKIIIANMMNVGRMKEDLYEEMRRTEEDYARDNKPLPLDFERKVYDSVKPRLDKLSNQFAALSRVKDMKPDHSLYFDQYDKALWVPNTHEAQMSAQRAGLIPAYSSNPTRKEEAYQEPAVFNGNTPQPPDEGGSNPLDQSADQIVQEQEHQEPADEQPSGAEFDQPYFQAADEYVDPQKQELREEGTLEWAARNATGNAAAAGSAVAGTPGDYQEVARTLADTNIGPYIKDIFGESAYNALTTLADWAMPLKFPTSKGIKEKIDKSTGGYTAPKTKNEERLQNVTGDIASAATSTVGYGKSVISTGRKLGTAALSAIAGNAGKVVAEELGASESKAEAAKMMIGMSVSLAGLLSPRNYANSLMNIGRKGFGPYDAANPHQMYAHVKNFQKRLIGTDPATSFAYETCGNILKDVREGKTSMNSLMNMYDGINRKMRDAGMFQMGKSDRQVAKHHLIAARNIVKNEINKVGKSNPQALKAWNDGLKANAIVHETQWAGNLANEWIQTAKLAKVAPYGMASLFTGGVMGAATKLGVPQIGAALSPAITAGIKTTQVLSRIYKSPELAKYYFSALGELTARNQIEFSKNYDHLIREYNKKYPEKKGD